MTWVLVVFLAYAEPNCKTLLGTAKRLCPAEPWTAECKVAQGAWIDSTCSLVVPR